MSEPRSLREALRATPGLEARFIWGAATSVRLADVAAGTSVDVELSRLAGASVLLRVADPIHAALALVDLDGVARRIVLCPPDLADADIPQVIETAGVDATVTDAALEPPAGVFATRTRLPTLPLPRPFREPPPTGRETEWVMFTSGTSGAPKMVAHTLAGLTGAIRPAAADDAPIVWGTFYDIRRYGGLQILLRALLGNASLVITSPSEPMTDFLGRLVERGVTHLTGTPSHWRRVLMTPEAASLSPSYVRLSGEIADQAVLDALRARFPKAPVGHAYASTEAGVGFEVNDGLAGFPAVFLDADGPVAMKVVDGSLRLRSPRAASGYLNLGLEPLRDPDGFVDSGDMIEQRGDRCYFVGRRNGVINVGGLKAHPEEIEAVIGRHPAVRACRVGARRNPITGALVAAEVVLAPGFTGGEALKVEILALCRAELAPFKAPATLRFVDTLALTAGGKMERSVA